ncbi:MAG TPA: hypothetical protein VFR84_00870 [Candidatus Angelobacter sp.]|nr:hypothetical protein [Candidatus Angelobacter sp.]
MKKTHTINKIRLFFSAVLMLLLAVPASWAQSTESNQQDSNKQEAAQADASKQETAQAETTRQSDSKKPEVKKEETEKVPDTPWYADTNGAYTVSLGTGALISLYPQPHSYQEAYNGEYAEGAQPPMIAARNDYRYQFFYGGTVTSAYRNDLTGLAPGSTTDAFSTSIQPYLAFFTPTKTGRYLLQYQGVINPNDTQNGDPQAYHSLTFSAMGAFNERWVWFASSSASYGSEAARLQGPLSFLVVQATPIADATSNAILLRASNAAFWENRVGLGWLKSRRDRITVSAFHTYTGIEGDSATGAAGTHANGIGAKGEYTRSLTQRIDLRSYAQGETLLNGPKCNSYGVGLGLGFKMSHSLVFDIAGGPQWTTDTCGSPVSATFSASLVKSLGYRTRVYGSVYRQFTTVARLNSRWEDTAAVGFSTQVQRLTFSTDAGYLRGEPITTVVPSYHGWFVAPRARFKLLDTLGLTGGYRYFTGSGGNLISGNLSYAYAGIEWYPAPLRWR